METLTIHFLTDLGALIALSAFVALICLVCPL